MKAYGVRRSDTSCCEGHNPFGKKDWSHAPGLNSRNALRAAKKIARQAGKKEIEEGLTNPE